MADDFLLLKAELDNDAVLRALDEIEAAGARLVDSGDKHFKDLGASGQQLASVYRDMRDDIKLTGDTTSESFKKGSVEIADMRKQVTSLAADLKVAAADAVQAGQDISEGFDVTGLFKGVEKINLDEIIELGQVEVKVDQLKESIASLGQSTDQVARQMGAALSASMDAVLTNTASTTEEIHTQIRELVTDANEFVRAFAEAELDPIDEQLQLERATTRFRAISEISDVLFDSMREGATDAGVALLDSIETARENFEAGATTAREYAAELRSIGTAAKEFKAENKDLFTSIEAIDPLDETLQLARAEAKIVEIIRVSEVLTDSLQGDAVAAGDALFASFVKAADALIAGTISAREYHKEINQLRTAANEFKKTFEDVFKKLDIDPVDETLQLAKAEIRIGQITDAIDGLVNSLEAGGQTAGLALIGSFNKAKQELADGVITTKEYLVELTKLSSTAKEFKSAFADSFKIRVDPIDEELQLERATTRLREIVEVSDALTSSLTLGAQRAGKALFAAFDRARNQLVAGTITAKEYVIELNALRTAAREFREEYDKVFEKKEVDPVGDRLELAVAKTKLDEIREISVVLFDSVEKNAKAAGEAIQESFLKAGQEMLTGILTAKEYNQELTKIRAKAKELKQANEDLFTIGKTVSPFDEQLQIDRALIKLDKMQDVVTTLFNSVDQRAVQSGVSLSNSLGDAVDRFDQGLITAKEFQAEMQALKTVANEFKVEFFEAFEDVDLKIALDDLQFEEAEIRLEQILTTAQILARGATEEIQDLSDVLIEAASAASISFGAGNLSAQEYNATLANVLATAKRFKAENEQLFELNKDVDPFDEQLKLDVAKIKMGDLLEISETLFNRLSGAGREAGLHLTASILQANDALLFGLITTEQFAAKMKELGTAASFFQKKFSEAFDTDADKELGISSAIAKQQELNQLAGELISNVNEAANVAGTRLLNKIQEVNDEYGAGRTTIKEWNAELKALIPIAKELKDKLAEKPKGDTSGAGGFVDEIDAALLGVKAQFREDDILDVLTTIEAHASDTGDKVAAGFLDPISNALNVAGAMFDLGKINIEEYVKELDKIRAVANEVKADYKDLFVITEDIDPVAEALKLEEAKLKLEEIEEVAKKLLNSVNTSAQKAGQALLDSADDWSLALDTGAESAQTVDKELNSILKTGKGLEKSFDEIFNQDISKELKIDQAIANFQRLTEVVQMLDDNASEESKQAAANLETAANTLFDAFQREQISVDELNDKLQELERTGKNLNQTYGEETEKSVNRATVSVWKMSRALDSVGVSSGGSVLRVFDAVKGLHPALIAAAAAAAGLAIALKKVLEVAIQIAQKLGKAFLEFTKGAVELAESFEAVESQLFNIFRGNENLVKHSLNRILQLSAKFGVDLTGELSQIFLPLVDSFAQFEEIAEIAATLAAKTGKEIETIARALRQGITQHFRPLQEQFGVLSSDIERIKVLQESLGDTAGLIAGLNEFFELSGTGWNTYEGDLRRVKGQTEETFKIFQLAFGEPVKNALVEGLQDILDWVRDNQREVENFFRGIGEAVGVVVESIGDFINAIAEDFDAEAFDEIVLQVSAIADNIDIILESLSGGDFDIFLDGLLIALEITQNITSNLTSIVALARAAGEMLGVDDIGDVTQILANPTPGGVISGIAMGIGGQIGSDLMGQESGFDRADDIITATQERHKLQREYIETLRETLEARRDLNRVDSDATDEEADAALSLNKILRERGELMPEIAAAAEEMAEAFAEFNIEMERAFADIFIEEGRKELDNQIANAQERLDMATDFRQTLEKMDRDFDDDKLDIAQDLSDDEADILRDHLRKEREVEIEAAKKIEDIEEKHLNRLKEIREKFDFDAQEAIRMNDAVALLRIRRRMELELMQEARKFDQSKEKAIEEAEDKRDKLGRLLDDELEDLAINNQRKIRDLIKTHRRELREEKIKYKESLEQQEIEEQRKREALQLWLDREVEDFNKMWNEKNEDLTRNMGDTIDIYEAGMQRVLEINTMIARLMAQGVAGAMAGLQSFGGLPFVSSQTTGFFGLGGSGGGPINYGAGVTVFPDGTSVTEGAPGSDNTEELRNLANSLAFEKNRTDLLGQISEGNHQELTDIINLLQSLPSGSGSPGAQFGSHVNPNVPVRVGEAGPETFLPTQGGIIAPHSPFMMSPQSQLSGTINTDNSRNVSADVSLLDPTHLSDIQKTLIRSIITEELLSAGI